VTVLVAPNAFKGSLTAVEAAAAMAAGAAVVFPDATIEVRPIADGGDGSVDCLLAAGYEPHHCPARGPTGRWHEATIAVRGQVAAVEMANSCGLLLLPGGRLQPLDSSTLGVGDVVNAALDSGADEIVICVGGGAATDGGTGLLVALGARLLDAAGGEVLPGGRSLHSIATIDLTTLDPRLARTRVTVATDVDNPLTGPLGAAHVFAPQKGADARAVEHLDRGLRHWARVLGSATGVEAADRPGAGAAGGTAFAAMCALGADVVPGAEFISSAVGLDLALRTAEVVITGEGSLDGQSLRGKGAVHVAREAQRCGVPCAMICGRIDVSPRELAALGVAVSGSLTDLVADPQQAMDRAAEFLARRTVEVLSALPAGRSGRSRSQ
jgi:glycerate kinase